MADRSCQPSIAREFRRPSLLGLCVRHRFVELRNHGKPCSSSPPFRARARAGHQALIRQAAKVLMLRPSQVVGGCGIRGAGFSEARPQWLYQRQLVNVCAHHSFLFHKRKLRCLSQVRANSKWSATFSKMTGRGCLTVRRSSA